MNISTTISSFPNKVDNLIFFQDIDIENKKIFIKYQELLHQEKYLEASQFLEASNISYYGADICNLLENMVYNLQNYLKQKNLNRTHYFSLEPPQNIKNGASWIDC